MSEALLGPDADPIVDTLRIEDEGHFHLDGRKLRSSPHGNRFIKVDEGYPAIVAQVGQLIYDRFYIRPGSGRGGYRSINDRNLEFSFWLSLERACHTKESWSHGWEKIEDVEDSVVLRGPSGRVRGTPREDFAPDEDGKGGKVRLHPTSATMQPGWFHVRGETDHHVRPGETVRLYWALCRAGAVPFIDVLTKEFNAAGIEFHMKLDSRADQFRRADAAVLYAPIRRWPEIVEGLQAVHAVVWPYLRDRRPAFTKPVATGIGLAEEPAGGGSFGARISQYCAQGLWEARDADDADERRRYISEQFSQVGIDPQRPYLRPGAEDIYDLDLVRSVVRPGRRVSA